ncbi:hypothetical protein OG194_05855 [Streptomyces sp. NBC_01288]|uniref:hypothetical protein n=1 Tax=Streptomyces sp. NBC_01288 TaxID=2903814 RepID=UPI002E11CFFC|nr:hypothetical protein OG194_05855 [Streptomyces sp. NBC_01288]
MRPREVLDAVGEHGRPHLVAADVRHPHKKGKHLSRPVKAGGTRLGVGAIGELECVEGVTVVRHRLRQQSPRHTPVVRIAHALRHGDSPVAFARPGPRRHEGDQCPVPQLAYGDRLGQILCVAQAFGVGGGLHQGQEFLTPLGLVADGVRRLGRPGEVARPGERLPEPPGGDAGVRGRPQRQPENGQQTGLEPPLCEGEFRAVLRCQAAAPLHFPDPEKLFTPQSQPLRRHAGIPLGVRRPGAQPSTSKKARYDTSSSRITDRPGIG